MQLSIEPTDCHGQWERFCLLVNRKAGMPVLRPDLFVTTQVRYRSLTVSAWVVVNMLLIVCSEHRINLDGAAVIAAPQAKKPAKGRG